MGKAPASKADYWRDGLYFYDAEANSRALIEQTRDDKGWGGGIHIRTQKGDAEGLLARLCEMVDREQERLGVVAPGASEPKQNVAAKTHRKVPGPGKDAGEGGGWSRRHDPARLRARKAIRRITSPMLGVSAARPKRTGIARRWSIGSAKGPRAQGIEIVRDRNVMRFGDSISRFMKQLAGGNRIYVVLSAKYLRSPFCMYELHEIYRECRLDPEEFRRRVSAFSLPDAKIYSPNDRLDHAAFWKGELKDLSGKIKKVGSLYAGADAIQQQRLMNTFALQTADILAAIADTLHPTSIDQIEALKFDP